MKETPTKQMRVASGNRSSMDPFVSVFYQLLRDHIPVGTLERVVQEVADEPGTVIYTNGWLAQYATYCAERLRGHVDGHGKTNDNT